MCIYNIQSITIHILKLNILEYQFVDPNRIKYSDFDLSSHWMSSARKSIEYIIGTIINKY